MRKIIPRSYLKMAMRFDLFCVLVLIYCSIHSKEAASDNERGKSVKKMNRKWTPEEEKELIFFDVLTNDGKPNSFARIKSYWHNAYPDSNVTDSTLRHKLYTLRAESHEEGERKKKFKWDHQRKIELLDVYHTTKPYKRNADRTLEEEWRRRHEDFQLSRKCLLAQVRKISNERGKSPVYLMKVPPHVDLEWDKQQDSDLIHAHNIAYLKGETHLRNTQRLWFTLYPQYRHVTYTQLRERIDHLENNPPDELFPWTEGENKELLDIFYKTMPDEENQGQRIHDIWTEIHPRYKFMTPYYLQVHASTLAHERELGGDDDFKKRQWMYEEKVDLMNLYHQHLGESAKHHGFHEEWVRKYPRLAYLTNAYLKSYARKLAKRGCDAALREFGKGSNTQKYRRFMPEQKPEPLNMNAGPSSESRRHTNQSMGTQGSDFHKIKSREESYENKIGGVIR